MATDVDLAARLHAEADRIEEDCTYSAKGHFESARIWGRWNLGLGIPAVLLATAAGTLNDYPEYAAIFAFASAAVTAVLTFLRPSDHAATHQRTGTLYNSLKARARFFKEIDLASVARSETLTKKLRGLSEARSALNEAAPPIIRPAFRQARAGIEGGEAAYRVDQPAVKKPS
jgi:hypothetical protein